MRLCPAVAERDMLNQPLLPFRPTPVVRLRSVRRPFHPTSQVGPYRLPPAILERLSVAVAPYKNRDAALTLAVFIGRFWSAPARLGLPFPIDRRALADHDILGLTEGRIRGALRLLCEIGFLDREPEPGSAYQRPSEKGPRKKPGLYRLGAALYLADFEAANRRSETRPASTIQPAARRTLPLPASRPVASLIKAPLPIPASNSPRDIPGKRSADYGQGTGASLRVGNRAQTGSPEKRLAVSAVPARLPEASPLEIALARLGQRILGSAHPGAKPDGGQS